MRKLRLPMAGVVILSLVASLPLAVVARGEEAAPTGFTGWLHGLPQNDEESCIGRLESVGDVDQLRDFRCEMWMGTSDPRFTGTHIMEANADTYRDTGGDLEDGTLAVSTVVRRVENDDGAWEAPAHVEAWWTPESKGRDTIGPIETLVFAGEGGYEGLTAVVWFNPLVINAQLQGVIFEGSPPPVPPAQ